MTFRLAALSLLLLSSSAFAQVEVEVAPPPVYAPPPPRGYYPPPPPPRRYYYPPRRRRYYAAPRERYEPWINPPLIRGTFGFSGFGTIAAGQRGGVEYLHNGGGFAIWGGVEIGRVVGIELKYTNSFHNPASDCGGGQGYVWCGQSYLSVESIAIDLKLHIPTNTRFVPYVVVGPMAGWIGRSGYLTDAVGGGFEAGGGFDVWFSRHGTVGVEAIYRGLAMGDYGTYTGSSTYLSLVQVGGTIAAHF